MWGSTYATAIIYVCVNFKNNIKFDNIKFQIVEDLAYGECQYGRESKWDIYINDNEVTGAINYMSNGTEVTTDYLDWSFMSFSLFEYVTAENVSDYTDKCFSFIRSFCE